MVYQRVQHIVELKRLNSNIATTRDSSNRTHVYLIIKHGPIYKRNGLNDTWEPLGDNDQSAIRELAEKSNAPHYVSNN